MHKENGETDFFKRIGIVASSILSLSAVIALIFTLWGSQVFATKEAFSKLEGKIDNSYVTKEVMKLEMQPIKQDLADTKQKVDKIYQLLLSWKQK